MIRHCASSAIFARRGMKLGCGYLDCGVPNSRQGSASHSPALFPTYVCSTVGLDADLVVDRVLETLLTAKISLGRLDGDVAQQELDLVQLASGVAAQAGAGSAGGHAARDCQWLLFWRSP